ncbi:AIR synthase-related protein [Paenibacillus alkalitolerans]|uniref:AIR synthase-related protein n=1 Tax=Paenibacillus alkalitolerans TaxID=2799335 RepID=UPI0018F64FB4|nr:AIR synthase-related protein [Paenibacillus alkalitolerans]
MINHLINDINLFKLIYKIGNVDEADMLRTFNMGVGMILVIEGGILENVQSHLQQFDLRGYEIGTIVSGEKKVVFRNRLNWEELPA